MNDFTAGWWQAALHRPSPNCDAWPAGAQLDMLIIHAISLPPQEFGGPFIDALFRNQLRVADHPALCGLAGLRVSAHFFIERGGRVVQFVPLTARAWHAGVSTFGGRPACNDRALGIELEGADTCPFTSAQYDALVTLSESLRARYPRITLSRIVGHSDVALGRKTDPGPCFDWVMFRARLCGAR